MAVRTTPPKTSNPNAPADPNTPAIKREAFSRVYFQYKLTRTKTLPDGSTNTVEEEVVASMLRYAATKLEVLTNPLVQGAFSNITIGTKRTYVRQISLGAYQKSVETINAQYLKTSSSGKGSKTMRLVWVDSGKKFGIRFAAGSNLIAVTDFLGTLIDNEKRGYAPPAIILPYFISNGGRRYPIASNADAQTIPDVSQPDTAPAPAP